MEQSHEFIEKSAPLQKDRLGREYLYVFAPVLVPDYVDLQKQWGKPGTIESAAHEFIEKYQGSKRGHKTFLSKSEAAIVESYVSKSVSEFDGRTFPAGTWFMAFKVFSKELIQQIQTGQITGFSIGGSGDLNPDSWPTK